MPTPMLILLLCVLAALAAGALLGWLSRRGRIGLQERAAELLAENRRLQGEAISASNLASAQQATAIAERGRAERAEAERDRIMLERDASEIEAAKAQTELIAERAQAEQLKKDRDGLANQFEVLASKILDDKSKAFTEQNETNIGRLLEPLKTGLKDIDDKTRQLEVAREGAYREVLNEMKNVRETHERLRMETTQLVQALRAPKVRGNWGELQLKRCIEYAGMVEHASFNVEVLVKSGEDRARPDCVIHLPNQRTIVIDAKTPFDAFLDAISATDETTRTAKMAAHGDRVRHHLNDLSSKAYWRQFENSPDFVVCFLSAEVL